MAALRNDEALLESLNAISLVAQALRLDVSRKLGPADMLRIDSKIATIEREVRKLCG